MRPSFHNFKAKPHDKAYVKHGERAKQVNSARTRWRQKLISGMLEGYSSTLGRSPRFAGRDRLAQANAGDSMSKAATSPTSRIPDTRPSQQGRVRKGVREEIIRRIINEITISNANVGSSNKADYADPGGGGGGGGLSGGFGSSGGGSRSFASTNSGEMARGTGNQRFGSSSYGMNTSRADSNIRKSAPSATSKAGTPPTSRASTPPATRTGTPPTSIGELETNALGLAAMVGTPIVPTPAYASPPVGPVPAKSLDIIDNSVYTLYRQLL